MKKLALALAVLAALAAPAVSTAKEPTSATIEGPGLDEPLAIAGPSNGSPSSFGRLVVLAGVPPAMFGHRIPDPMRPVRPQGTWGRGTRSRGSSPDRTAERTSSCRTSIPLRRPGR